MPWVGRFFIVGGAGFIGSHFCDAALASSETTDVTIYDNFSSGRKWHFAHHLADRRFRVVHADVNARETLIEAMRGHDVVIHLASNPDIARALVEPDIDFREGTALTNHVLEAMRLSGVKRILYASGSGVYGEAADVEFREDHHPLAPISTYAASKLAGEALIRAYAHMFDMTGLCFRFGNVVGPRQTHGVGFDLVKRLRADPTQLRLLGDGLQTKSYIAVTDAVSAVLHAHRNLASAPFATFNVATDDSITVNEIARLACNVVLGIKASEVRLEHTGGDRGWKGDVPVVRLNCDAIKQTGWPGARPTRDALLWSMRELLKQEEHGLL